jgi:cysteine desulfurase/selenocysteine lyase
MAFDPELVRKEFPMLQREMVGKPFIYLDTAATAQKPNTVINAITKFYSEEYATVHRGVYEYAIHATERYSEVRRLVQAFVNAGSEEEIVFTRGATEAINIVAHSYAREFVRRGDEILISEMEHHSNIVPWQIICEELGANLVVAPMNNKGELILEEFEKRLSARTKIVAICHISNFLGTINPVKQIVKMAHKVGAVVILDGAQSAAHLKIDVQDLNVDFFAFSGHKIYGPTGIGVLYGKKELLQKMRPYHGGGDMIQEVTFAKTTYQEPPLKFEAGTPPIAEVMGLGAAIEFLMKMDQKEILRYEEELLDYATENLLKIPGLTIYGSAIQKSSLISFTISGIHSLDLGVLLGLKGIAIRTGALCASPALHHFGLRTAARISFGLYNTYEEIDRFLIALHESTLLITS